MMVIVIITLLDPFISILTILCIVTQLVITIAFYVGIIVLISHMINLYFDIKYADILYNIKDLTSNWQQRYHLTFI